MTRKPRNLWKASGDLLVEPSAWAVEPMKSQPRPFPARGFDTETGKRGGAFEGKVTIIADSEEALKLSEGQDCAFKLLTWLTEEKRRQSLNFFYNLEYDALAIIKHFPHQKIKDLAAFGEAFLKWPQRSFKVEHIPKKCLQISRVLGGGGSGKTKSAKYFDISQFYETKGLVIAHNKNLVCKGECSKKVIRELKRQGFAGNKACPNCPKRFSGGGLLREGIFLKSEDASQGFDPEELTASVEKYCIGDAAAGQRLGEHFVSLARQVAPLRNYYSPASLAKQLMRQRLERPYQFQPSLLQDMAFRSFAGGRIECMKRGFFDKGLRLYDIRSAYPAQYPGLAWVEGKELVNTDYEPDSLYSFFLADVEVPEFYISPMKSLLGGKYPVVYPNGVIKGAYLSKLEYETMLRAGVSVKIEKACHLMNSEPYYPFGYVKEVYDLRAKLKREGNELQLPMKLALNSMYGVTIQLTEKCAKEPAQEPDFDDPEVDTFCECLKCGESGDIDTTKGGCPSCGSREFKLLKKGVHFKAGQFFNPVWAASITSGVRCKIFEDSLPWADDVVFIATDCLATQGEKCLPFSEDLGFYEDSKEYGGLVLGSGVYSLASRDGESKKSRLRGFGQEDLLELAEAHQEDERFVYITKQTPRKLKESLRDLSQLNNFRQKKKSLQVNFDVKRNWLSNPASFKDALENVYDSVPLCLS